MQGVPGNRPSSSRQALSPSSQLVNSCTGPLGSEYGTGIPDRLCVEATLKVFSKPSLLLLGINQSDPRGVNKAPSETGDSTATYNILHR